MGVFIEVLLRGAMILESAAAGEARRFAGSDLLTPGVEPFVPSH